MKLLKKKSRGIGESYQPASKISNLNVDVPDSMASEMRYALSMLVNEVGDVDLFVCNKLKYKNKEELSQALSAEQVDAVALGIYNIEFRDQSLIVGDQTGVGKGRIAAAMIRYGIANGLLPIFVTEKPSLFTDIYRDLYDVMSEDFSQILKEKVSNIKKKVQYKDWANLSEDEKVEYGSEDEYLEFQQENEFELVSKYKDNPKYNLKNGNHVIPFILNSRSSIANIKDRKGNIIYEAPDSATQKKALSSGKLPSGYNLVLLTYTQLQTGNKVSPDGNSIILSEKCKFIKKIAKNNLFILDESHNASGKSTTGMAIKEIMKDASCFFLSATFAKKADNMAIYAMKTVLSEANLSSEALANAVEKGGNALQEVLSSQLVSQGQMIRRERTYQGIEVNYITLDEKGGDSIINKDVYEVDFQKRYCSKTVAKYDREKADAITRIIRDIIAFQDRYVIAELSKAESAFLDSLTEVEIRKGTKDLGISNTPFASKVFNIINQMLFSIKAEAVADRAIMRLKQGKKPVVAFSNTMGAFVDELDHNVSVNADFATVLIKGLNGSLRYTLTYPNGVKEYGTLDIKLFSLSAQEEYNRITENIYNVSSGLTISPIDLIKKRITDAGFSVAEVTARKNEVKLSITNNEALQYKKKVNNRPSKNTLTIPDIVKTFMNPYQQQVISESKEFNDVILLVEENIKSVPAFYFYENELSSRRKKEGSTLKGSDVTIAHLHYFSANSDWFVSEWDGEDTLYGYAILDGNYENAEFGYLSLNELRSSRSIELDLHWTPKPFSSILNKIGLSGIRKAKNRGLGIVLKTRWAGVVSTRDIENTTDAFWEFNNNKVDVLMINQSGSTGVSAHSVVTEIVGINGVKQRCLIVCQAELDINKEMQKRGRVNRTGQISTPIYDYISSSIPAENRLMMMLKKKLKSLDSNTSSNQKNSDSILNYSDFLNKYGDEVVYHYLRENPDINRKIGDPLKLANSRVSSSSRKKSYLGSALKATGKVAILDCREQARFYDEVSDAYRLEIDRLMQSGEYDLEVQVLDLEASVIKKDVLIIGKGGRSPFGSNTYIEQCEINQLRKPISYEEVIDRVTYVLAGKTTFQYSNDFRNEVSDFYKKFQEEELLSINEIFANRILALDNKKSKKNTNVESEKLELLSDLQNSRTELRTKVEERLTKINWVINMLPMGSIVSIPTVLPPEDEKNAKKEIQVFYDLGVFVGYSIDSKKANPYTESNIRLNFLISGGRVSTMLNLTGDSFSWIKAILKSRVRSFDPDVIRREWSTNYKNTGVNRVTASIVTGNVLQAFGYSAFSELRLQLVSFTTSDGRIRKGILLPNMFSNSREIEKMTTSLPAGMSLKVIKSLSYRDSLSTNIGLAFTGTTDFDRYRLIFHTSKRLGYKVGYDVHLDPEILELVDYNVFSRTSSNSEFRATISGANLKELLDILQKNYYCSLNVPSRILKQLGYMEEGGNESDYSSAIKKPEPLFVKSLLGIYNQLLKL